MSSGSSLYRQSQTTENIVHLDPSDGNTPYTIDDLFLVFREPGQPFPPRTTIEVPGTDGVHRLSFSEQKSLFPGTQTVVGRAGGIFGDTIILTQVGDALSGHVHIGGREFSFNYQRGKKIHYNTTFTPEAEPTKDPKLGKSQAFPAGPDLRESFPEEAFTPTEARAAAPVDGLEVIDVLITYNPNDVIQSSDTIDAASLVAIELTNQAMINSEIGFRYRVVGMEVLSWFAPSGDVGGGFPICDARAMLRDPNDGEADQIHAMRDSVGADLVVHVVPTLCQSGTTGCSPAGGCAYSPPSPRANSTNDKAFATVRFSQLNLSTRHELAHFGGLFHGRDQPDSRPNARADYAYGYTWPDPLVVSDPSTICANTSGNINNGEPHRTIMSTRNPQDIGGTRFNIPRSNYYSNPSIVRAYTQCGGGTAPTGSNNPANDGRWADASTRLRETLPEIANYRDQVVPYTYSIGGAQITSPAIGANVYIGPWGQSFSWEPGSPSNTYWLEVYSPSSQDVYFNAPVTGTSSPFFNTDGHTGPLAARLWTNVAPSSNPPLPPIWVYRDHRYNVANTFVDCADDELILGAGANFFGGGSTSEASCSNACTQSGDTITCSLNVGGGGEGHLLASSPTAKQEGLYDFTFRGSRSNGSTFCCLYQDPQNQITSVLLRGGPANDTFLLSDARIEMQSTGAPLDIEIRAYGGDDFIIGSSDTNPTYSEYLRGYNGADILVGRAGDDRLGGGYGGDTLIGGSGEDVLWAGNDGNVDELFGQEGENVLCTRDGEDLLLDGNTLYVSSLSPSFFNPDTDANFPGSICGHYGHGNNWGHCSFYFRSTAPTVCANMGAPD